MKPPLKPGPADYVLIALTCLLVLLFFERFNPDLDDWLRQVTQEQQPHPEPVPDAIRDWLERRKDTARGPENPILTPRLHSPHSDSEVIE